MLFIDLEKAYDSIPRGIIQDSLKARGISQKYIEAILQSIDQHSNMSIQIKVGLHQRLALSHFIFYSHYGRDF